MGEILNLFEMLIPVIIGIAGVPLFGVIKNAVGWLGKLPAWAQQVSVVVQTWFLALASGWIGVALPGNLAAFDISTVEATLAAGLAFILHLAKKQAEK